MRQLIFNKTAISSNQLTRSVNTWLKSSVHKSTFQKMVVHHPIASHAVRSGCCTTTKVASRCRTSSALYHPCIQTAYTVIHFIIITILVSITSINVDYCINIVFRCNITITTIVKVKVKLFANITISITYCIIILFSFMTTNYVFSNKLGNIAKYVNCLSTCLQFSNPSTNRSSVSKCNL